MLLPSRCSMGTMGSSTSFDFQFVAKFPTHRAIKLGYSEPTHNVLPYKLNNLFIFNGYKGFGFYPFAEIVSCNQ